VTTRRGRWAARWRRPGDLDWRKLNSVPTSPPSST
jgi:hypothetical protein